MAGEIQLNNVTLATESGGTISLSGDVDTLAPTKDALNASGSAPIYACRAWVNFNGTGTVAIRESGNVSSITDNGTGNYTVNFTTAMPDANYQISTSVGPAPGSSGGAYTLVIADEANVQTSSVQVRAHRSTVNFVDLSICNVAIFR